jgi:hypothetical protein
MLCGLAFCGPDRSVALCPICYATDIYLFGLLQATLVVPGVLYLTESLFINEFSLDVVYVLFFFFVFLFISFRFVLFHPPPP